MDSLNEEFAKLEFLGGFPPCSSVYGSAPKTSDGGAVENSALKNNVQHCRVSIMKDSHTGHYNTNPSGLSPKKAGPTVPPKPQKNVKLPETDGADYNDGHMIQYSSLCSHPRLLHRKQSTLGSKASFNKMKEFTLDNPAILDQQLEALAHHKMQLEKKGILQKSPVTLSACHDPSRHSDALKVSLSSLPSHPKNNSSNGRLKATAPCPDSSNILLSNPCTASHLTKKTIIKTADETKNGTVSNMYHNTNGENDRLENFASPLTTLNIGTEECLKNIDGIIPPSPVSSSYSELHRATDIFSKISALITPQKQEVCHNSSNHLITGAKTSNSSYSKFNETPSERNCDFPNSAVYQNFMSMNYNNEYVNFNDSSSSQSISQGSSDYYGYGSCSQGSSTYESIYEPITPRPSSQLSARSNYLMYVQYANSTQTSNSGIVDSSGNLSSWTAAGSTEKTKLSAGLNSSLSMKHHIAKEPEMEALTDYLVHSVDSANDVYSYGVCVKCNERVVGEKSGCTAMDQVYHISCFTCSQCQVNLQGKPFYALECKPYCEYDYLQTLEKCSICTKPILERILRATGKPYHPQCFTCVVCGNSLDGIPFTVDATNQNYCIADFHKKFAPRCCVCEQPIMPEPGQEETVRVVALDRSFHFDCYKCEDCGLLLSSEAEGRGCYPLDDHVLCKSCNAKRVQLLTNRMTTKL